MIRGLGRGQSSGVEQPFSEAHVWTVREGRIVACELFLDADEALRAAGAASG